MDDAMKKLLLILVLLFAPSVAWAQCNGTFGANTTCGSVSGGPPGQVSLTTTGFTFSGVVSQPATNLFFKQNGAVINRMNDRLFIAGATVNDGTSTGNQDWLSVFQIAAGASSGTLTSAQGGVLNNNNASAGISWLTGAQTLNFTNVGTSGLADASFAVNNNATLATNVWAYYGECHNTTAAVNTCTGLEVEPRTTVAAMAPDSYTQGNNIGIQVGCGAGLATTNHPCSSGIQIVSNPETFGSGIVFLNGSITATSGVSGTTPAISLPASPNSYQLVWTNGSSNFAGSLGVNSSRQFVLKASGQEFANASGTNIFDCNITSGGSCVFSQNLGVFNGGTIIWENSTNTGSFGLFNNNQTFTFQQGGSTIGVITQTGDISGFAGIDAIPIGATTQANGSFLALTVFNGNTLTIRSAGNLQWNDGGNTNSFASNNTSSTWVFNFNGGQIGTITSTGNISGFAGLNGTPIGATTSAAASVTTLTLSTATFSTSNTGAGTQTFTNSPCGALTTERWLPVKITGSVSLFFIPACS